MLSWNEIRHRSIKFSREWKGTTSEKSVNRPYRKEPFLTDRQRVEYLFALYEQLTAPLVAAPRKRSRRRPAPGPAGDAMILDGGPGEP